MLQIREGVANKGVCFKGKGVVKEKALQRRGVANREGCCKVKGVATKGGYCK